MIVGQYRYILDDVCRGVVVYHVYNPLRVFVPIVATLIMRWSSAKVLAGQQHFTTCTLYVQLFLITEVATDVDCAYCDRCKQSYNNNDKNNNCTKAEKKKARFYRARLLKRADLGSLR